MRNISSICHKCKYNDIFFFGFCLGVEKFTIGQCEAKKKEALERCKRKEYTDEFREAFID